MKKLIYGSLALLGIVGLMMPATAVYAKEVSEDEASELRDKYNNTNSDYDASDYMDYDYNANQSNTGQHYTVTMTDRVCWEVMLDNITKREVYGQGRIAVVVYTNNGVETAIEQEWYPASFSRKTKLGILADGTNPNEYNDSLIGFLDDLIGNSFTVGVSYDSFINYLTYLEEDFGMTAEESEAWKYKWREFNNALTEEDLAEIAKQKEEAEKYAEEIRKELEEAQKAHEDNANELEKNELTLYQREAKMIEMSIAPYVIFDAEKFITLRERGYSFSEASKQSQTIDYDKAVEYLGEYVNNNEDTIKDLNDKVTSESVTDSLNNVVSNMSDFLKELFGFGN